MDAIYWRSLLLVDPSFQQEENGQFTIFHDTSDEPPDPDDFFARDFYEKAYQNWARKHPELHQALVAAQSTGGILCSQPF